MQRITWYGLFAVVALVTSTAGWAQAPTRPTPQPTIREIATLPGVDVKEAARLPNGRVVIYADGDGIFAYDLKSKRSTLVTRGYDGELGISRAGDRIAYDHDSSFLRSTPINPATGAATGPAQRVTVREGDEGSFSPDGKLIAFEAFEGTKDLLTVVPVTGGPERVLAAYEDTIQNIWWSADGKSVFVLIGRTTIERVPVGGGPSERLISTSGRIEGPFDGRIAFHRSDATARSEGRMAYATTSGAHGEFTVPPGSGFAGLIGSNYSLPLWLLTRTTGPSTAPTSTIYEIDMRPLVKAVVKR